MGVMTKRVRRIAAVTAWVGLAVGCGSEQASQSTTQSTSQSTTASQSAEPGAAVTIPRAALTGSTPTTATPSTASSRSALPVDAYEVVDARGVIVAIESTDRVIPLDGDVAEIVFALGLGDLVVATDLSATFPPEADALPQIGYQRALSTEPIVAFEPTLLIATDLAGPPETLADLERLGIPLVIVPSDATRAGPAAKIRAVAEALGVPGDELAATTQRTIDAVEADASLNGLRVLPLYVRGDSVQLVLGAGSGIDWLIQATGAIDVGTELGVIDNAQLTAEAVIAAAPDVLLVTQSGLESVGGIDGLLAVPGLAATPAGEAQRVLAYDDQLMLGNGARTGTFLQQLQSDLQQLHREQNG